MTSNHPSHTAELDLELGRSASGAFEIELRFHDATRDTEILPVRCEAPLDLQELRRLQANPVGYGEALSAALFSKAPIRTLLAQARAVTENADQALRLRLRILDSAGELHTVRWELLRDPTSGAALTTSEQILFSRFMVSRDWRQVRIGPKAALRALVAVAAPSGLTRHGLSEIDRNGEIERATRHLGGIAVEVIQEPLTLERLAEHLRKGYDILYLVCHGALSRRRGEPALFLADDLGEVAICRGADLTARICELVEPPRLTVLASCESAGSGELDTLSPERGAVGGITTTAQSALAPQLAAAGVAAVLAMQGKISMETVRRIMPVFFRELLADGRLDRALSVARGTVRDRPDHWMPVLSTRLKRGRIWYEPGFSGNGGDFSKWRSIVASVRQGRCVPIIGSDFAAHLYGSGHEVANQLNAIHRSPLRGDDRDDLTKIAQYVSTEQSRELFRDELTQIVHQNVLERQPELAEHATLSLPKLFDRLAENPEMSEPHVILSRLPLPIYVNACREPLLTKFLKAAGRQPEALLADWRPTDTSHPRCPEASSEPTVERPLVHHVFGVLGKSDSLVITEDDFFDYMLATAEYKLIPSAVRGALSRGSLLFLGFPLDAWTFRVLFRMITALSGKRRLWDYAHVGVQIDPAAHSADEAGQLRGYMERYFGAGSTAPPISIYWGTAHDFLVELQHQMDAAEPKDDAPQVVVEDDDDWLA